MAILKKIGNGFKDVANIFFDDLTETEKEKAEKTAKTAAAKPKSSGESAKAPSPTLQRAYPQEQIYKPQDTVHGSVRQVSPPGAVNLPGASSIFDKPGAVRYTDYDKGKIPSPAKLYTPEEKKKSEDAWYNKINHGSYKEDDWFMGMVRNQEKAEAWYTGTYGKKDGNKEYLKLHNRLLATPYEQHQKEAERFKSYTAEDFKVPTLRENTPELFKFKTNGKSMTLDEYANNTLKSNTEEKENRTTGCYKEGDERLPFLTNYIINGNDGKTGGLNKVWQNAESEEERARIERVAEMLRAEATDYDITKSSEALILYDAEGAMRNGHTAIIIKNSDGHGVYFSFAEKSKFLVGKGEISFDILNKEQMDLFLRDGNMQYIGTSSGTVDSQHYTDYIKIPITSEQGASMIGKGISYFVNPGGYSIVKFPKTNQCDSVVSNILNSGNVYYDSKWRPKKSFYDYNSENDLEIYSITE